MKSYKTLGLYAVQGQNDFLGTESTQAWGSLPHPCPAAPSKLPIIWKFYISFHWIPPVLQIHFPILFLPLFKPPRIVLHKDAPKYLFSYINYKIIPYMTVLILEQEQVEHMQYFTKGLSL